MIGFKKKGTFFNNDGECDAETGRRNTINVCNE